MEKVKTFGDLLREAVVIEIDMSSQEFRIVTYFEWYERKIGHLILAYANVDRLEPRGFMWQTVGVFGNEEEANKTIQKLKEGLQWE